MVSSRIHILAAAISIQILNFVHKGFVLVFTTSGHNNSFPQFYWLYFRNGQPFHRFGVTENIRVDYFIVELVDFIVGFFQFLCKGAVCVFLPILSEHQTSEFRVLFLLYLLCFLHLPPDELAEFGPLGGLARLAFQPLYLFIFER